MIRLRQSFLILALIAAPVVLYQSGFGSRLVGAPLIANPAPMENAPLIQAVKNNDLAQVKSLLAQGADINVGDSTTFFSCTDPHPPSTRRTPLILSMFTENGSGLSRVNRDTAMMDLLLKHGANPNIGDVNSKTPLHFAASFGNVPAVRALLSHGADAKAKDDAGDTPLIEAAYRDNGEVVKLLLAHGADVNAKGQLGFSALARTTGYRNNIEIMKLLIAHGADVNTRTTSGATPLHGAAEYGRTEAMQILLQHGADANAKDSNGQTPLMMISGYGTKALDKWQDDNRPDKIAQRQALMNRLLTNAASRS
jgi:ankyrin repeat protein